MIAVSDREKDYRWVHHVDQKLVSKSVEFRADNPDLTDAEYKSLNN